MKTRLLLGGLKSLLPVSPSRYTGTGGSSSSRYCYSVWLRHLLLTHGAGLDTRPRTLVELGPGDSIGVGLAALLTGTERYLALDVVQHSNDTHTVQMLDELPALFLRREPVPGPGEFPRTHPLIPAYDFPRHILTDERLAASLAPERVEAIRNAALRPGSAGPSRGNEHVRYVCPWYAPDVVADGTADMVLGQGVLQDMDDRHADDTLTMAFRAMARWLRPGGVMSHQVELACPGGDFWNEHWTYPDLAWRVVRGGRPYYKNRAPMSRYLRLHEAHGFDIRQVIPVKEVSGLRRDRLAERFRGLSDEDLNTRAVYILAVKR